jgi:hypothetical protein
MVTITWSFSSTAFDETELGIITVMASGGFVLVAMMKKDNNRNATSQKAVISTQVLFLAILGLGINSI